MHHRVLVALGGTALALVLTVRADPPASKPTVDASPEKAVGQIDRLSREYKQFESQLLRLTQRLEKSPRAEDRSKAEILRQAIEFAGRGSVESKFERLLTTLSGKDRSHKLTLDDLATAAAQNDELDAILKQVLDLLLADHEPVMRQEEIKRLKEAIKQITELIQKEKIIQIGLGSDKIDNTAGAKAQENAKIAAEILNRHMGGQPSDPNRPNSATLSPLPGQKQVQDSIENINKTIEDLKKNKLQDAPREIGKAIEKLQVVKNNLERRFQQLREEGQTRLLVDLQGRCERMLAMQIEVHDSTQRLDSAIKTNLDRKPTRAEEQHLQKLSDRQSEIVKEVDGTLRLLESDRSAVAVAFTALVENVRRDTVSIERQLDKFTANEVTQQLEKDVIQALKDAIDALKKSNPQNQEKKNPPPAKLPDVAKNDELLADKLADAIKKLEGVGFGIEKVIDRMPKEAGSDEFRPVIARMADLQKTVTNNRDGVREVLNECDRTLKELQTKGGSQSQIDRKRLICNRLDEALVKRFATAEAAHAEFAQQLEKRRPVDAAVSQKSRLCQKELVEHLAYTRELLGVISFHMATGKLRPILDGTSQVKSIIGQLREDATNDLLFELGVLSLKAGNVEVAKGERKVVAVELLRTDLDGRIRIRLKPSAGSNLSVVESIMVPAKTNQMQFEIVAGNTAGDFVIQVSAESPAGTPPQLKPPYDKKPFEIKVKVK